MKLKVYSADGTSSVEKEFNNLPKLEEGKGVRALKDLLVAYQANARQGNACAKTKAEVSGTGKKPWRQKGTGMARHGSKRSPIWVGGGVAHGPRPRSYTQHINKKVKDLGFKRALIDSLEQGKIALIQEFDFSTPKTKACTAVMSNIYNERRNTLVVDDNFSDNAVLSARNVPNLFMIDSGSVNAWDIVKHRKLLFTERGFEKLLERISD